MNQSLEIIKKSLCKYALILIEKALPVGHISHRSTGDWKKISGNQWIKIKGKEGEKIDKPEKKLQQKENIKKEINKTKENIKNVLSNPQYKNYKLAIRESPNIEGDLKRNWSAWGWSWGKNKEQVALKVFDVMSQGGIDSSDMKDFLEENDLIDKYFPGVDIEDIDDEEFEIYQLGERLDNKDKIKYIENKTNAEIVKDEKVGKWALKHHDGLSIYNVSNQSMGDYAGVEDVMDDIDNRIKKESISAARIGQATLGDVKLLGKINNKFYLLMTENYENEEEDLEL